jgi:alpha-L-rhamnosidase
VHDVAGFQSPNMNSFNHYSLGSVGEWLYRYVAGIDLGTPGYDHIVIRPRLGGGLTHASGDYDSVRGRISSSWKFEDGLFSLEVLVPPNTTATVHVPSADGISEGGRSVEEADGVKLLRAGEGETVLSVGSGRYEFSGRMARG